MEFGDWSRLDRTLATTLEQWRRRTAELGSLASLPDVERDLEARELARSPVPELLIHEETRHALAERADDPLARALRPWIETFWLEDAVYGARHALAVAWGAPRAVRGRATETSARTLRRELIDGHHASVRERAADDLLTLAESVHERAVQLLERRIEREASVPRDCRMLVVPDFSGSADDPATEVVAVAERVLVLTDELSAELRDGPWFEGPRRGLAAGARDGWPVRPTLRWLREVFGCDELTRGLPIRAFKLPAALGAASYARALGAFGMRVLEAARPATVPIALHQHPGGLRKHAVRALFASIVAEESFAARVLRQGKGPTRDHRRHVLAAFVTSLRIDALRVLVLAALRGGVARGRERYRDLAERVLGRGAPGVLIGVMPSLRPGDGAALAGSLAAIGRRFELVATHDEDWFRNPRALAELRDELSRPRPESSVPTEQLVAPLIRFREELERLFG